MDIRVFTDPSELKLASGLLHDRWFDVRRIAEDGGDLVIPFASEIVSRAIDVVLDSELRIGAIRTWRLIDKAQVDVYDFFGLSFDERSGRLTIESNIPLTIEIEVGRLDIRVALATV